MTHPIIRSEIFIETANVCRFQAMLRSAWQRRSWHVIVADPGSGKTMGIRDLVRTAGSPAILAVTAPKNNEEEQALGNQLFTALGLPLRGRWSDRKPKLIGSMVQFGVKCLIVDDAQDLSLEHLMFIKELTDQGRLHYEYPLGLCLADFRTREHDSLEGNPRSARCHVAPIPPPPRQTGTVLSGGRTHTGRSARDPGRAFKRCTMNSFRTSTRLLWSTAIYTWLTQPVLDPTSSGRVTMDYLMKLVTTALEWSYQAGETDVKAERLQSAASLLVLRRDTLRMIDGAGPNVEVPPSESATQERVNGMQAQHVSSRGDLEGRWQLKTDGGCLVGSRRVYLGTKQPLSTRGGSILACREQQVDMS